MFFLHPYSLPNSSGEWIRGDASGCQSKCGMGEHGTDGLVACSKTSGCDGSAKPSPKKCVITPACGK